MDSPVTITGCAAVTALGDGLAPLERALAENTIGLRPCARFAGKNYQTNIVGAVPDEIWADAREAPAFFLAHRVIRQLRPQAAGRVGFVLSTTKADITALERGDLTHRHILPGQLAADLAVANNITGPVRCVSVACVSGLLTIQTGAELLQRGLADSVIVAGVDLLSDFVMAGFTSLKSLDPAGCRPFDKDRVGLSIGEGAGAVLLTRDLDFVGRDACRLGIAPSCGVATADGAIPRNDTGHRALQSEMAVTGWGSSNDANHLTGPSRDGAGLALAMQRALRKAGIQPSEVDYVHAHGTGTLYNDSMEALALRWVFGDRVPPFSSSKGVFGHTLGAAGILETILCVLAARAGIVPGTPRLQAPASDMPSSIQLTPARAALRCIMKINAGFGGTNAALVLQANSAGGLRSVVAEETERTRRSASLQPGHIA